MENLTRIKSLIVTTAADFRTMTVQSLNAVGYPADKQSLDNADAIAAALEDPLFGNVVIDTSSVRVPDLHKFCADLTTKVWTSTANFLVYLPEERMSEVARLGNQFPRYMFRALPFKRQDIIDALVKPRGIVKSTVRSITSAKTAVTPAAKPAPGAPPAAAAKSANAIIVEAVEHVRETVESLKQLAAGKEGANQVQLVRQIGQRFNGVYGTFLFFANRDGYLQLGRLCEIIDAVSRSEVPAGATIPKAHLELLLGAARCALSILKELRSTQPITATQKQDCAKVEARYQAMGDVFHRRSASQDDVDALLELTKKGA